MVKALLALMCLIASGAMHVARGRDIPIAARALRPAFGEQTLAAVAGSGSDFMSAWMDGRSQVYDSSAGRSPRVELDVYASRIDRDGSPDPAGGVVVSPTYVHDGAPAVIWNGQEYVVVSIVTQWGVLTGVMLTRVTEDGPQNETFVPMGTDIVQGFYTTVAVAWNGSEYLVVLGYRLPPLTTDPLDRHVVHAFVADARFQIVRPVFEVSDATVDSILPSVATDGTSFLVTWVGGEDRVYEVRTAVVSASGRVDRSRDPLTTSQLPQKFDRWPAPAVWDGQQYLVTWGDNEAIRARFVDRNATPAPDTLMIARAQDVSVFAPSLAWNGSVFLVAFAYRNERKPQPSPWVTNIDAMRVRTDGTLIDESNPLAVTSVPGLQAIPSLAASGERFLVAWDSASDIHSAIVDPVAGTVTTDALVSRSIGWQSDGAGAFAGHHFGVLWTEDADVLFGRVSIDGQLEDGPGVKLSGGTSHAIVSNGNIFLAAWRPGPFSVAPPPLNAVRITSNGDLLDGDPIALRDGGDYFASDGKNFLVITHRLADPNRDYGPHYLANYVVTESGTVTRAADLVATQFSQDATGIAWNGSHYLVVYGQLLGENAYPYFAKSEGRAIVVDREGRAVGTPIPIDVTGGVAGGNGRFLVAGLNWTAALGWRLLFTILDQNGIVVPLTSIRSFAIPPVFFDAAWDGSAFLVAAGEWVYRIDGGGTVVEEKKVIPAEAVEWRFIPAHGAAPVLIGRLEKLAPGKHEGGIARYVLRWTHPGRTRSVAR